MVRQALLSISLAALLAVAGHASPTADPDSVARSRQRLSIVVSALTAPFEEETKSAAGAGGGEAIAVSDGSVFSSTFSLAIRTYQVLLSSQDCPSCQFVPSCSSYCVRAIGRYGVLGGILRCSDRIQRCHPYASGYYPVDPSTGLARDFPADDACDTVECGE